MEGLKKDGPWREGSQENGEAGKAKAAARSGEGWPAERATGAPVPGDTGRRLGAKDREFSLLAVCRYLTVGQIVRLGCWATTVKAMQYRLRGLSGESTISTRSGLSTLRCSDSCGSGPSTAASSSGHCRLLGTQSLPPNSAGFSGAANGCRCCLRRALRPADRPLSGTCAPVPPSRHFTRRPPLHWDVTDQVELPWRENTMEGKARTRVVRPDAVLEIPSARRRIFIECETGSHTLVPRSPEKHQATLRKLERYDDYVCGLADAPAGRSHYRPATRTAGPVTLFLVPSGPRRKSTASVVETSRSSRNARCVAAQALALPEAAAYLRNVLPPPHVVRTNPRPLASARPDSSPFYGEVNLAV